MRHFRLSSRALALGVLVCAVLVGAARAQEPVLQDPVLDATPAAPTAAVGDLPSGAAEPAAPAAPVATATPRPPTRTVTETRTPSETPTATPTLAIPDDPVGVVIYGVVVAGSHAWLPTAFPAEAPALRRLYEPRQMAPLWTRDGKPSAAAGAVIDAMAGAGAGGLVAADYSPAMLRDAAARLAAEAAPTSEEIGLFDAALSVAALRFTADLSVGRVNPRSVGFFYDVPPKHGDQAAIVAELASSDDPAARLAQLDPSFPQFAHLREALARYRALAGQPTQTSVPLLPKLTPGARDAGVPALRAHLAALGDLPPDAVAPSAGDEQRYDTALVDAVRRFQARHGLGHDGVVGPGTLAALRVPPAVRAAQIELAMERLRWLPAEWPQRFIFVNLPEFRLRGYAGGDPTPALEMNVVVGQAVSKQSHKTPVLQADMQYLVFRPYWMVPSSIATRELWPKIQRDPDYLARNNMEVRNGRIRQRPGRGNSLGQVKFIFPNPHHVYLHDTPSKGLFVRARRDYSHGCVRVADPPALAEWVLADTPGWDRARIERAMRSEPNDRHVPLTTPLPVYLFYTTVVVEPDGAIHFFDDIYGHDATLLRELAKGART